MTGAGDFLYFELPFVHFAERSGHPLGYTTDVDLHADPHLLDGARAVITLGHDEYWSAAMRNHVVHARAGGVNLAFLGGGAAGRHRVCGDGGGRPVRLRLRQRPATAMWSASPTSAGGAVPLPADLPAPPGLRRRHLLHRTQRGRCVLWLALSDGSAEWTRAAQSPVSTHPPSCARSAPSPPASSTLTPKAPPEGSIRQWTTCNSSTSPVPAPRYRCAA